MSPNVFVQQLVDRWLYPEDFAQPLVDFEETPCSNATRAIPTAAFLEHGKGPATAHRCREIDATLMLDSPQDLDPSAMTQTHHMS
jgi:hypothetical protein